MEFIQSILDGIVTVIDFIKLIPNFLSTIVSFIPNPFRSITLAFIFMYLIIFVWKLFKGGGD